MVKEEGVCEAEWSVSLQGTYVKISEIQMSAKSEMIALAYQDNGVFQVKVISRMPNNYGEEITHIILNQHCSFNYESKPIDGIYNPLITCCFLPEDRLFISVYHRVRSKQYHFIWDIRNK